MMKFIISILFFNCFLYFNKVTAQNINKIVFKYRCVPTKTDDYSIEITSDKFILSKTQKIVDRKGERVKRVNTSLYTYSFDSKEKETFERIIKTYSLDSVGLYEKRTIEWGPLWEVEIKRNHITYLIDLPNYNNPGLESLISFIVCLISKKELPRFECKKCAE